MDRNIERRRSDGLMEILNPTIDRIEIGMMVRRLNNSGIIIAKVDSDRSSVLIGDSLGGTAENWNWTPVEQIRVVWSTGKSFNEALELIYGFDAEVKNLLNRIVTNRHHIRPPKERVN